MFRWHCHSLTSKHLFKSWPLISYFTLRMTTNYTTRNFPKWIVHKHYTLTIPYNHIFFFFFFFLSLPPRHYHRDINQWIKFDNTTVHPMKFVSGIYILWIPQISYRTLKHISWNLISHWSLSFVSDCLWMSKGCLLSIWGLKLKTSVQNSEMHPLFRH